MTLIEKIHSLEGKYEALKGEFEALKVDVENLIEIMKCYATQQVELNMEFKRLVEILHG